RDTKVAVAAIDLAGRQAAEQVAAAAAAELGTVDVLVNNAAVELQRRFHTLVTDEIENVIRVDLITPIALTRLLLPAMLERGYGRIINISSIAGRVGFPYTEAYAASKDGLIAFGRVLRKRLPPGRRLRHRDRPRRRQGRRPRPAHPRRARPADEHLLHGHAGEGRQDRRPRDRKGQSGDRARARPRPLSESADGSLPRLGADHEPDQRRREVHGPGRRSPRSTPRGDAEKGAGDVIDGSRRRRRGARSTRRQPRRRR